MGKLVLRLYLMAETPHSQAARRNLAALRAAYPDLEWDVDEVDILRRPEQALKDGILVTPALIKIAPPPECRLIGDLGNTARVLAALGLAR